MSDDLTERLRDRRVCSPAQNSCRNDYICDLAAARIEELEAKLAKAENGLFTLSHIHDGNPSDARADILPLDYARHMLWEARSIARTTLAELKGETDD